MGKKIAFLVLLIAVAGASVYFTMPQAQRDKFLSVGKTSLPGSTQSASSHPSSLTAPTGKDGNPLERLEKLELAEDEDAAEEDEDATAAEKYKSAEDAMEAVKKASVDYDDTVLNYFVEPGQDCSWCPAFYQSLKTALQEPGIDTDRKAYYAEILAISGKLENVQTLVEGIKSTGDQETKEALAESLELAIGDDKIVEYLSSFLVEPDETLKEATVAALSNQGSRLAAEVLYKNAVESKNADGFYSLGIGLGEFVPEEEALPFLHEKALKRDEYSHLAVKALLNSGLPGLTIVVDIMSQSNDSTSDDALLKDAEDHVIYEKDVKVLLEKVASSNKNPKLQEFAKNVLRDFDEEDLELDEEEEEDQV